MKFFLGIAGQLIEFRCNLEEKLLRGVILTLRRHSIKLEGQRAQPQIIVRTRAMMIFRTHAHKTHSQVRLKAPAAKNVPGDAGSCAIALEPGAQPSGFT